MSTPISTYRLQIRPSLTLSDAAELTDYLADLGVDAVYLSPILTATSGSDHGYDCTDPTTIDPARGGEEGWQRFVTAAKDAGLKVVVDIVPNHVGISKPWENPYWWDVLAKGAESEYASWFDIDWSRDPILVPVLGEDAGDSDFQFVEGEQGWEVHYYDQRFPLAEDSYSPGDAVADVLERQNYRLASWRTCNEELNYRRFFAVSTLAGIRQEDPAVFDATHERIRRFITEDGVAGLRVDHPDGVLDPTDYLTRLRELAGPDTWIIAEKILEAGESCPAEWPIGGTTGYDAMTEVNQVFVDTSAEDHLTEFYQQLTGDHLTMEEEALLGKSEMASTLFGAELSRLAALVPELPAANVKLSLIALAAPFPVYRSYLPLGLEHLEAAAEQARALIDQDDPGLLATLDALVTILSDPRNEIARRFQQLTGAVMAKGVEDTAYYRANRFVALNEVGGNPARFGLPVAGFHEAMARRQAELPESMTSLATHDTKRGEDVRARLAVLSEIGEAWERWATEFVETAGVPNKAFGYLMAQVLVGAGYIERERLHAYAEKAMREAADGTGWIDSNTEFEDAVHAAVDAAYDNEDLTDAWARMLSQVQQPGRSNALAQKLVQITMPGVPDVYQGTELWDSSLVDPDNRRPVDFAARRELLSMTTPPPVDETGKAKFWVVRQALRLRKDRPELFTGYTPVHADGEAAEHFLGFDRGGAITAVTRLPYRLGSRGRCSGEGCWGNTTVTLDGRYTDVLSGETHEGTVRVNHLFSHYPVALLVRSE